MQRVGSVATTGAWGMCRAHCAGALLLLSLADCTGVGQGSGVFADPRASIVAIDSVDGPPPQTARKLERSLHQAASTRQIAIVPREAAAPYRLRGYLAVQQRGTAASVSWAWDVYGSGEQRAFRLSGEEQAKIRNKSGNRSGGKSWAVVDDEMLDRIASASVTQLAVFLAAPRGPAAPDKEPPSVFAEQGRTLLNKLDDFSPEAAGIFRLLGDKPPEPSAAAEGTSAFPRIADVPLPPARPAPSANDPAALAYTDSER